MSEIRLDEATHRYYLEDGQEVPSVGSMIPPEQKDDSHLNTDAVSKAVYIDFGRAVHRVTELYDRGMIADWPDPLIAKYLGSYKLFHKQSRPEIVEIEQIVHHSDLDYAGTPDRVVRLNERTMVLDIKTGSHMKYYWLKVAAYAIAHEYMEYRSNRPFHAVDLALLYLKENGYSLLVCNHQQRTMLRMAWEYIAKGYHDGET